MAQRELAALTDQELVQEAKKMKSNAVINATFIGFLIGIIVFSVVKHSAGLFTLIPLFLAYKLIRGSNRDTEALKAIMKERNLEYPVQNA